MKYSLRLRWQVLIGVLVGALGSLPGALATPALSCRDLVQPEERSVPKKTQAGYYFRQLPPTPTKAPLKDYRLYVYSEDVWQNGSVRKYKDPEVASVATTVSGNASYVYSVRSNDYPSEIAFFSTTDGFVFGVTHVELYGGNSTLNDKAVSKAVLASIYETVIAKRTESQLDAMFSKAGNWFYRFNLAKNPKTLQSNENVMLTDPSLKLYSRSKDSGLLVAHRTFESNGYIVEVLDTIASNVVDPSLISKQGDEIQTKLLNEILDFVFPLYAERRGWSESFISALRKKAFETVNSTKYIVLRDPETREIIATIGLSRAPYGKTILRNEANWNWEEWTGAFGSSIHKNGLGPLLPKAASLHTSVPVLPMEDYLGDVHLPRPAVLEVVSRTYQNSSWLYGSSAHAPKPSAFDPFFAGSGIIYEPTKFGISKNLKGRKKAHATILKELFAAVFDLQYENQMLNYGQYIYTYNDAHGIRLYQTMGFQASNSVPVISKDGTAWTTLSLSPQSMIEQMKAVAQSEEVSEQFARELELHLAKVHER